MKYTKQELIELTNNATLVETYKYTDRTHRLHTDFIRYIGNGDCNITEIENLPYDDNGEVNADVELMTEERYNETILANCGETWQDMYEEDDIIAVIVIRN